MYIPCSTRLNGGYPYYHQYCKPRAKLQQKAPTPLSAALNFPTLHSLNHSEDLKKKNKKSYCKHLI